MLQYVADNLGWIIAICGAAGTAGVVALRTLRRATVGVSKVNQVLDVLLGRPAIRHPETGEELVAESPGIGTRMAHIEKWQNDASSILITMAETQRDLVRTNTRVDQLHDKLNRHLGDN